MTIKAKGRQATPSNDNQLDQLQKTILQAEETLAKAPAISLNTTTIEKRRGARVSKALAYNTLPKSLDKQSSIFDLLNQDQTTRKLIIENNLDKIGAELSVREWRALWAIPRLLHDNGIYRENDEQLSRGGTIQTRELVISLQDYLKAYKLDKTVTSRGKLDYSGQEVQEAIQGLRELTKPVMQVWAKKIGERYKYAEQVYGGLVSSVAFTYYDPDERTYKEIQDGDPQAMAGAKFIRITPSKIFYTNSFMRLPEQVIDDLRDYLKKQGGKLTPTDFNIATLLALEASNGNSKIIRDYRTMLSQSGQNRDLQTRNTKRGERRVNKALDDYKAIGAIKGHRIRTNPFRGKQYEIDIDPKKITGDDNETKPPLKKPKKKYKK